MLTINQVKKKYEKFELDCSLQVEKGCVTGLIGRNGAGKSTFMKVIAGLSYPTEGTYSLFGKTSNADKEKARRHIGSMIEMPALYPN